MTHQPCYFISVGRNTSGFTTKIGNKQKEKKIILFVTINMNTSARESCMACRAGYNSFQNRFSLAPVC